MEGTISAIRARRLLLGLTLADVSAASNISEPHLSRVERGQRGASQEVLRRLAATLEVSPQVLFTDDAEATR